MDSDVIFSLVQNAALLLAMVFVYDAVPRKQRHEYYFLWRISVGTVIGGITVTTMMTHWEYQPGVFFDARSIILGISGLFFGGLPTLVAMVIASVYRFLEGGSGWWAGIGIIFSSGLLGSYWRYYRKSFIADLSFKELYIFGFTLQVITLLWMFVLPFEMAISILSRISFPALIVYPIAFVLLGLLLSRRLEIERDAKIQLQDDFIFRSQFNVGNIGIAIS